MIGALSLVKVIGALSLVKVIGALTPIALGGCSPVHAPALVAFTLSASIPAEKGMTSERDVK